MHSETAVIVLAAGAGTRMRSDTPKVLHTLAGRSMLAHALHAVAKVAPQHLVVVLGHDRERVGAAVAELAERTGPPDRHRGAGAAARHRARRACAACPRCPTTSPAPSSSPPATSRCSTPTPWPT